MRSNTTKVWIFILFANVSLLMLGYQMGGRWGLLTGFFLALLMNFFLFFYGENRILHKFKAHLWKGQDPWGLNEKIEFLCKELHISIPALYVFESESTTAFSVGLPWGRSSIAFSTGLLKKLGPDEIESVLVHQVCHIRRLDSFLFGLSSLVAHSIVGIGEFLDRYLALNFLFDSKKRIFQTLLSPLGWVIIKTVVRHQVYFENDALAAEIMQDRRRLAEVLWRLEGLAETKPQNVPVCTSHLFVVNPEGLLQRNLFLKSHPPTAERIKRLIGYYPI